MEKEIKMIGLDLDGTLLDSRKELSPYTREVLAEAIEKGVTVLVATGRPLYGVPGELLDFPGMRYVLTANGARIIDHGDHDRILWEQVLPDKEAADILRTLQEYDTISEVFCGGQGYIRREDYERIDQYVPAAPMAEYIRRTRCVVEDVARALEEHKNDGVDKVQAIFRNPEEQEEARRRVEAMGRYAVSGAMGNNLEINAPDVNKGNGLVKLGQLLGIRQEEIMACGDGSNDIAMIRMAGLGVAMGNATEAVKEAADYVTETNDEDGAAKAIAKFVCGKEER